MFEFMEDGKKEYKTVAVIVQIQSILKLWGQEEWLIRTSKDKIGSGGGRNWSVLIPEELLQTQERGRLRKNLY